MLIRIEEIKEEGLNLDTTEEVEDFTQLKEIATSGECTFVAPLRTQLRAVRVGEMVEVEGTVETQIRLACSRCLKEYETPLSGRFALTFTRQAPQVTDESGEEEVELSAEEMGLVLFHGEELDLGEQIAEQVIMALPMRPLCREECRGLCPQCGVDRNAGECGCEQQEFSIKFAALKNFKAEKK